MAQLGLFDIADIFTLWVQGLASFWETLNLPINQLFSRIVAPAPGDFLLGLIYDIVDWLGSGWLSDFFGSFTLLEVVLGGSIFFFAFVTLVKWIIDILP